MLIYVMLVVLVFFFKQKTAYEIQYGLVGSEMCIRDSNYATVGYYDIKLGGTFFWRCGTGYSNSYKIKNISQWGCFQFTPYSVGYQFYSCRYMTITACLLYTSDAADDLLCVDLGGRRIIKKKKTNTRHTENRD